MRVMAAIGVGLIAAGGCVLLGWSVVQINTAGFGWQALIVIGLAGVAFVGGIVYLLWPRRRDR